MTITFKDIINADLPTVAQWLRQGFAWWTDELSRALPDSWRKRLSPRPDVLALVGERKISFRGKSGTPLDPSSLTNAERRNVKFIVPEEQALIRVVEFPLLPMSDVRRMLSLDLDRLTPFSADQVYFDAELIRRDAEKGRQQILLGVLPKAAASDILARAASMGIVPSALAVADGTDIRFDFLPAIRGSRGGWSAGARLPYWWAAVGVMMMLNVGLISYRDSAGLDSLQQIVDSQSGPVEVALRLRGKVEAEEARRASLIQHMRRNSPLRMLEAVTKALPANAWTQTFEWNGQSVHLVGYSNGPADMLRALESSPMLHNARHMSRDTLPVKQTGMQPFDVAADAGKGSGR